jgi:dihydroorotate dehydrogenase
MAGRFEALGVRLLFRFDPEAAHRMAVRGLAVGVHPASPPPDPRLARTLFGLAFPSPVGLAAGFDKSGEAVDGLLRLGFGFVEIGSVTPRPQQGNPKPRLFRLPADRAIINRFGFNNDGAEAVRRRLAARSGHSGIVGVNLGANKDSADLVADYVRGVEVFAGLASYLAINVSSPNTPGLRDLQEASALSALLRPVLAARDQAGPRRPPVLVKLAPDIDADALFSIVDAAVDAGADGLIVSNTTLSRDGL